MRRIPQVLALVAAAGVGSVLTQVVTAQQPLSEANEKHRNDLGTSPQTEVIVTLVEWRPGHKLERHSHPGIESGYVIEGGKLQLPDGKIVDMPTGTTFQWQRDQKHAGFTVAGDKPMRAFLVHAVDKGKPVYNFD